MGWESSDRKSRLPRDWYHRRNKVLARDNYRCRARLQDGKRCPNEATDADHVRSGDNHSLSNLQALCGYHHGKKSSAEGIAAMNEIRQEVSQRFRSEEQHPADLW